MTHADTSVPWWQPFIATLVLAIAVPLVWWAMVVPDGYRDAEAVQLVVRLALLSALFWGAVLIHLAKSRARLTVAGSLGIGLVSPIACAALAFPFGLLMLPLDLLSGFSLHSSIGSLDKAFGSLAMSQLIACGIGLMPLEIFPVGAGMGLMVGYLASDLAAPARPQP